MKILGYILLLSGLCLGDAFATTPIQLRQAADPDVHVSINNVKGEVSVFGWDRDEVQVSGQLGDGAKPLTITGNRRQLAIRVAPQRGSGWLNWRGDNTMAPTRLELHVPRAASLDIHLISARLTVAGIDGGSIVVNTVSGKALISARTPSLKVVSVSGSVRLTGHAERADLQTVSGDILAPDLGREVELQTISGHIRAGGGPWQRLTLSTVSGEVQLNGELADSGHMDIDSMSGDVRLQLPASTSAKIHASSFSGDLNSDFGTPEKAENGPGSTLQAQLGNGRGSIHIETFSGDLRLSRKD